MISLFFRWLSLGFCLLLSWGILVLPYPDLPQPVSALHTEAETEKTVQLQGVETQNKKKTAALFTELALGGTQSVFAGAPLVRQVKKQTAGRGAQIPKAKILAVPVGRLAPPVIV